MSKLLIQEFRRRDQQKFEENRRRKERKLAEESNKEKRLNEIAATVISF